MGARRGVAAHRIRDGQAEARLLTKAEAMWLRACWLATAAVKDRSTHGGGKGGGP